MGVLKAKEAPAWRGRRAVVLKETMQKSVSQELEDLLFLE